MRRKFDDGRSGRKERRDEIGNGQALEEWSRTVSSKNRSMNGETGIRRKVDEGRECMVLKQRIGSLEISEKIDLEKSFVL